MVFYEWLAVVVLSYSLGMAWALDTLKYVPKLYFLKAIICLLWPMYMIWYYFID